MFGRAPRGSLGVVVYPQQSTSSHGVVREKGEHLHVAGVRIWKFPTRTKRVPCVCQLTASPVRCPSVFPSAPDMWSRAEAGKMGIYAWFHAMWCCRAGSG